MDKLSNIVQVCERNMTRERVTLIPKDFQFGIVGHRVEKTFKWGYVLKNRRWESIDKTNGSFKGKEPQG